MKPTPHDADDQGVMPLIEPLDAAPDPAVAFQRLSSQPHCVFLDSALRHPQLGRYSFLAADPFHYVRFASGDDRPLKQLAELVKRYRTLTVPGLPPFQGGAAGLLSYDLNRSLEQISPPRFNEFNVPTLAVGLYDVVLAYDHQQDCAWIVSTGFPELDRAKRRQRARSRIDQVRDWLTKPRRAIRPAPSPENEVPVGQLAPQHAVGKLPQLTSSFSSADYQDAIRAAVEYIYAGDVFQVNLAQRLLHPAVDDSVSLYQRLRERNPAPFSAYFDLGDFQIASASPERFVTVQQRRVEARPIKGTRPRTALPEADLFAGDELQQSEKDLAENVMIVDLLRNDLSRVCEPSSVHVSQLCQLEIYQYVQHLVSVVNGRLRDEMSPLDLVAASFPGGSITGAPKVRAMEIIAELEPTARGPYCGSLGYVGFDGSLDMSILIRTITAGRGWWQLPVGGGIVAQSDPRREYEETWHKAEGLLRALHAT